MHLMAFGQPSLIYRRFSGTFSVNLYLMGAPQKCFEDSTWEKEGDLNAFTVIIEGYFGFIYYFFFVDCM